MSGATTLPANRTDFIQRGAIKTSGEFAAKEISREKLDKKIEWNGAPLDAVSVHLTSEVNEENSAESSNPI